MPNPSPHAKEPALKAFGNAIRTTRQSQRISQEELAFITGIDRSYLGAIERGEQNAGLSHMVRIAAGLNLSLKSLMGLAAL